MSEIRFSRRAFLNKPGFHSVSNIMIEFEDVRRDNERYPFFGNMYISDCNRTCHFDLDVDTVEGVDNSVHKLSTIIEICEDAKKELVKIRGEIEKWAKDKEKKADKNKK